MKRMDKESSADSRSVLTLTKRQVAVILLLFIVSLVAVGLLAGLIRPTRTSLAVRQPVPSSNDSEPWLSSRLPQHVLPVHYDLTLFPDFYQPGQDGGKFYGNVSILINVTLRSIKHLLVHAHGLTIRNTSVRPHQLSAETRPIHVERAFDFRRHQYWVVELDRDVRPGSTLWLDIQFDGSMVGRLSGLYRTSYVDSRTRQTRFYSLPHPHPYPHHHHHHWRHAVVTFADC